MLRTDVPTLEPMLRKIEMRIELDAEERAALLGLPFRPTAFEAGAYIVREGYKTETCALILEGYAHRQRVTTEGGRQIFSVHLRGDAVDLQNTLLPVADHSVQALTRVSAAIMPRQAIVDVAARFPTIARALWLDTMIDSAIFREWIVNVARRNARQRIAHLLCEVALRQESAGLCQAPHYEWPLTQEQLGDATGLTSIHVNRTLKSLREEGLIEAARRSITILDWKGLQSAGDFNPAYLHLGGRLALGGARD